MIDSVGYIIPVKAEMLDVIKKRAVKTERVDQGTGEILFDYHNLNQSLSWSPSWSYNVQVALDDRRWIYDPRFKKSFLEAGHPHVKLFYSVPKVLLGHNVHSVDAGLIFEAAWKVKDRLESENRGVDLGKPEKWFMNRLDVCGNYVLPSEDGVKNTISYMQGLEYPRRLRNTYESTGLYFASRHTTVKVYAKGCEFKKHDYGRFHSELDARRLYNEAVNMLRIEVELKRRLKYLVETYLEKLSLRDRGYYPVWNGYTDMSVFKLFDPAEELESSIKRFLLTDVKESKVMKACEVRKALQGAYSEVQARSFYAVYVTILTEGVKAARRAYSKNLVYRSIRAFRDHGITFFNADRAQIVEGVSFPDGFSLAVSEDNPFYQVPLRKVA